MSTYLDSSFKRVIRLVILRQTESICLSQESVLSMIIPSSFWLSTFEISSLSIVIFKVSVNFQLIFSILITFYMF